jgi:hypothetical protein
LEVQEIAESGVPDRVTISTEGRSFATDLLQMEQRGNYQYDFELHSDETAKVRRVLVDSLQKQEGQEG